MFNPASAKTSSKLLLVRQQFKPKALCSFLEALTLSITSLDSLLYKNEQPPSEIC